MLLLKQQTIFVAGHTGFVGAALVQKLQQYPVNLITATRQELDLTNQQATRNWLLQYRPNIIIIAAAKVGGIAQNRAYPVEFLQINSQITLNLISVAAELQLTKLIFLGSSCMYPRLAEQPITEDSLLTASLEPTNEAFALSKILGTKLCQSYYHQYQLPFITVVPTNLYGPGDHFDAEHSHVIAAMISKIHQAKQQQQAKISFWGTGKPLREFLYIDDAIDGLIFLLQHYQQAEPINLSGGETVSIQALAQVIAELLEYKGDIIFDSNYPDGMPKKSLAANKLRQLGWQAKTTLRQGLTKSITFYREKIGQ